MLPLIATFADRHTQQLYETAVSKRLPANVVRRARRKLEYIDAATRLEDLRVPPGNRLHRLAGDRAGQYSVSINDQWRVCFRYAKGDAFDVEITDYH